MLPDIDCHIGSIYQKKMRELAVNYFKSLWTQICSFIVTQPEKLMDLQCIYLYLKKSERLIIWNGGS